MLPGIPLSVLALALKSAPALASEGWIDGRWLGTGTAVMSPDTPKERKRLCSRIGLDLVGAEGGLQLNGGYYVCEDLQAEYGKAAFGVRDGIVTLDGREIGRMDEGKFEISVIDSADGVVFHFRLAAEQGAALGYLEEWIDAGRVRLRVTGSLRRS